jgi:NTP pyrophosphatase (non-canonical NTP hydrolase)
VKHFNELTPAEAERLAVLLEELGETSQAIGKILRHGYASRNPLEPHSLTNREALERELGDIQYAILAMTEADDVDAGTIADFSQDKAERIGRYLHHNSLTNAALRRPSEGDR